MDASDNNTLVELVSDLELKVDKSYQSEKHAQFTPHYSHNSTEEKLQLRSIIGSSERSGQWVVPKHIYLTNVLGSIELDFTDAIFEHQHVTIHLRCVRQR